ncbi:SpoIIE family protein phosphatase [Flavobacteriaceae bacterium]|nr:SpoIIE family protein phosphatase [Flavobacteriaceae bacterium]
MSKSILKSVFLLLTFASAYGQVKTLELPISNSNIHATLKASNGMLWVGTDEGLNLIYGKEKKVFFSNIEDSLSILNSDILKLSEGINKELIVLSKDGLSIFDSSSFSFSQIPLESEPKGVLLNPTNKTYWVFTRQSGIYVLDNALKTTNHFEFDPLNPLSISTSKFEQFSGSEILFDEKSGKTIIATKNGLNVYDENLNAFKRFFKGNKTTFTTNNIIAILPREDNKIGVITQNEYVDFYPEENRFESVIHFETAVESALLISSDKILINTAEENILLSKKTSSDKLRFKLDHKNELKFNQFIEVDKYLYVWEDKGNEIIKTDSLLNPISSYNIANSINAIEHSPHDNQIYISTNSGVEIISETSALINDVRSNEGVLYFSNFDNQYIAFYQNTIEIGVLKQNKGTISFIKRYDSGFTNVAFDKFDKNIILGNDDLMLFDIQKKQLKKFPKIKPYLKNGIIKNIKVIENDVYCALENGVIKINAEVILNDKKNINEQDIVFYEYNELLNPDVPRGFNDIEKIGDKLYVTDDQRGLSLYDKEFSNFEKSFTYDGDSSTSLASSSPTKLFFDENQNILFIGTIGNGMFKYNLNDQRFSKIDMKNGLLSNNIFDFLKVKERLFIQTGSGVNFIEDGIVKNINNEDGLNISRFHKESMHQYEDEIVLTGYDKIQSFKLSELDKEKNEFNISVLNIVGLDDGNNETNIPIGYENTLDFDYKTNTLIFDLFSDSNFKSEQIHYYFKRGENAEVISNGFNNKIQLSSFPYYASDIEIYAIDGDGKKSINTLQFTFNNAPPWWLRIETIVLYVILSIILIYSLVKIRETQTKKRLEGERKSKELEEARELQNSLLPKTNPTIEGFQISTYLKSATEIGGDYYDFFYKKGEYFYAICGDATGHGVISGIMVSVTKAGLNGITMGTPSKILQQLNRIVKRVNFGRLRMSLSVAKLNKDSVELSSAAMPPTYYFNAKANTVEEVLVPNLPLGGIETEEFDGITKDFNEGDVIVMISDGLPELPNPQDELLDYQKVEDCVRANAGKDAESIKNALVELSDSWASGVMNPDDITIVVIKKAA